MDSNKNLPHREASRDEFIELMVKNGSTPAQAELQVKISKALGSDVLVDQELLTIKKETSNAEKQI